ncbi:uncharacterized protein LOC141652460 [Silene latifolia]|uniref:uncharacterized protein LOC141652460 n=1 Tax=Silene latifolia TaxID=37657 RepID=UPI003D787A2B
MLSAQFIKTDDGKLYKKTAPGALLRCIDRPIAGKVMEEVYNAECGSHMNAHMLVCKIIRLGYYWTTMEADCFKKWVEAKSYKVLKAKQVAQFILNDIICRYGVPHEFISDCRTHFQAETAGVAAKDTFALWRYRTSIRTAMGATPYYLVYGIKAVQPVELELPSMRILLESHVPVTNWVQARYDSLVMFDERHLNALYHVQLYQKRIERAFNKKVKLRGINEEDLVLKSVRALLPIDPRVKFKPNWAGPYLVKKILTGGAVRLIDLDGNDFTNLTNLDQFKK